MNAKLLSGWLDAPDTLGREAGAQLDALTRSFPYFQTAQLLYIKTLHNENSFLYNNQLKVAAAYASNRRMLYELITRKTPETAKPETEIQHPAAEIIAPEPVAEIAPEPFVQAETVQTPSVSEAEIVQPEFPKKRFAASDEWEAGMLRQLQLLHHWRNQPETVKPAALAPETSATETQPEITPETAPPPAEPASEPTAADEINTLLYVLAEPGDWEDELITEEPPVSETTELTAEEPATWEVQPVEDISEEKTTPAAETEIPTLLTPENISIPAALPNDPIEQLILAGAVSASITQEVDDRWPSPDELQPKPKTTEEQPMAEIPAVPDTPEPVATTVTAEPQLPEITAEEESGEMSFTGWLKKLSHQTPAPESVAETVQEPETAQPEQNVPEISTASVDLKEPEEIITPKTEDELPEVREENIPTEKQQILDRFIREEPRIKPNKNKFYNPVNMAKQSVQESDEFITETLARIYVKQGNLSKAIRAYQKLSLKFPEKSTYFAALIEELKRTPK
jgi:hypothetical protein